ncbi:MAG: hypothetical protein LQ338_006713 [Usnochroma carphineum]|nr:MAG: hypothetical protein LQ338_006713 [Usnochroma carphineum]
MSVPKYSDYGIPEHLAVPPGELIEGWTDTKASFSNRSILYNQAVINAKLNEIIQRLERLETPTAAATAYHEPSNRGTETTAPKQSEAVLPMQQYLSSHGALPEPAGPAGRYTGELPPLVRRFGQPEQGAATTAPGDSAMADLAGLTFEPAAPAPAIPRRRTATPPPALPTSLQEWQAQAASMRRGQPPAKPASAEGKEHATLF